MVYGIIVVESEDNVANQTPQDAFERVIQARIGCLVNATDDFLLNLQSELHRWADDVRAELLNRAELFNRIDEQNKQA